ncbi:MAG: GC-type dockerin domain-anchored protein [Phycisphaerales bacterium JB039]
MTRAVKAAIFSALLASSSAAQDERILIYRPWTWRMTHDLAAPALIGERASATSLTDEFLARLRARPWDLVVIRSYERWARADEIFDELELHMGRGGRLLIQHAEIDEWPELQMFVGLDAALDLHPMPVDVLGMEPFHPSIDESGKGCFDPGFEWWPDFGDVLAPGADGYVIAEYVTGGPAIVVTEATQIIVNGAEWDPYSNAVRVLADQMKWLLSCPPDLDGSGELDFFDFLTFLNLFAVGDRHADFAYDRTLDLFDFLEFQNAFAAGCP